MSKSTKVAVAAPVVDATDSAAAQDLSNQMANNPAFKTLLAQMVKDQSATIAAESTAAAVATAQADADAKAIALQRAEFAKAEADRKSATEMMAEIEAIKAELEAEKAKASKASKKAKVAAAPVYVAVAYVPQDVKKDKVSGEPLTGKRAGVWPAKCAITPAKYAGKRPTWVNAEILRTVLDNVKEAKAVLAKCDAANAAE